MGEANEKRYYIESRLLVEEKDHEVLQESEYEGSEENDIISELKEDSREGKTAGKKRRDLGFLNLFRKKSE